MDNAQPVLSLDAQEGSQAPAVSEILKPCPFCGRTAPLKLVTAQELAEEDEDDPLPWPHSESWAVICDASRPKGPGGCGASGGFFPRAALAKRAWNGRVALQQTRNLEAEQAERRPPEPVAKVRLHKTGGNAAAAWSAAAVNDWESLPLMRDGTLLYEHPPREWQALTDGELDDLVMEKFPLHVDRYAFARGVEAALEEKNRA